MTIKPIFVWQNLDSTVDLNNRSAKIIKRAIFKGAAGGGQVTPSGIGLTATVAPFVAHGFDGMVVSSDSPVTVTFPLTPAGPPAVWWIALKVQYVVGGSPIVGDLSVRVPDSVITSGSDKDFYIRFAKVTIPFGTTVASAATWDFSGSDHSDNLGNMQWRDSVATYADLPPAFGVGLPNHVGDVRVVRSNFVPYMWDVNGIWQPLGNFLNLQNAFSRNELFKRELSRSDTGSGIISLGHNTGKYADDLPVSLTQLGEGGVAFNATPPGGYIFQIGPFHADVNGHRISTKAITVPLDVPPLPGSPVYDIVYVEVWRESIAIPPSAYASSDGGTLSYAQVETLVEQIINEANGFDPGPINFNFDFNNFEVVNDGYLIITRWQFITTRLPSAPGPNGVDPSLLPIQIPGTTGGKFYVGLPAQDQHIGTNEVTDLGIWVPPIPPVVPPYPYQGVAYALPLFALKRYSTEGGSFVPVLQQNTGYNDGVPLDGVNVFDIAPRTDALASRHLVREAAKVQTMAKLTPWYGGVAEGMEAPITWTNNGGAIDAVPYINFPAMRFNLTFPSSIIVGSDYQLGSQGVLVDAPTNSDVLKLFPCDEWGPAYTLFSRRDLVYLVYWLSTNYYYPYIPGGQDTSVRAFGPEPVLLTDTSAKRGLQQVYAYGMYVTSKVWQSLDTFDSFVNVLGFSATSDPGVYAKAAPAGFNAENFVDYFHAIPLAIVHRRNSSQWSCAAGASNFNGSSGIVLRPEHASLVNPTSAYPGDIMPKEFVDLRHQVSPVNLDAALEQTLDQTIRGKLATRLVVHPIDNQIAGTSNLIIDGLGSNGVIDPYVQIVPDSKIDRVRAVWSDAPELQVVSWITTTQTGSNFASGSVHRFSSSSVGAMVGSTCIPDQFAGALDNGVKPLFEISYGYQYGFVPTNYTELYVRAPQGAYIHCGVQAGAFNAPTMPGTITIGGNDFNTLNMGLVAFNHLTGALSVIADDAYFALNISNSKDTRGSYNYLHDSNITCMFLEIIAVDLVGRPTEIRYHFNGFDDPNNTSFSGQAAIQVAAAFVYDKPNTAQKSSVDVARYGGATVSDFVTGLSSVPKQVYGIDCYINSVLTSADTEPLYKIIPVNFITTDTATLLASDPVFAGLTGVKLYGILDKPFTSGSKNVNIVTIKTTSNAFPAIGFSVTLDTMLSETVYFKVAYTSNEKKYWFDVCPANKGLRGPFHWTVDTHQVTPGLITNATTSIQERWYTSRVSYPTNPTTFSLGIPITHSAPGTVLAHAHVPFGWFSHSTAHAFCYVSNLNYTGMTQPYSVVFGRSASLSYDHYAMYWDVAGPLVRQPGHVEPNIDAQYFVYAALKPLDGNTGDHVIVYYESSAYQGIMGDNLDQATRVSNLTTMVVPAQNQAIRYEATSDLFCTTAGTGLAFNDPRDFKIDGSYLSGGTIPSYNQWLSFSYDQTLAAKHGINPFWRQQLLASTRLNSGYDLDTVMSWIPGPPNQYTTTTSTNFFGGKGPGIQSDYDHSSIGNLFALDNLNIIGSTSGDTHQNFQNRPASLVRLKRNNGQLQQTSIFGASEPNIYDASAESYAYPFCSPTIDPNAGYVSTRIIDDATLAAYTARVTSWTFMAPTPVGRKLGDSIGNGTQGIVTARVLNAAFAHPLYAIPSENVLQLTIADSSYLNGSNTFEYYTDLQPTLLSESSTPVASQNQGNTSFQNQNLFWMQRYNANYPDSINYPTFLDDNQTIATQKFWAFKGSVINKEGKCVMLVNSGWGSDLVYNWNMPGFACQGVRPNTGYSADAYQLIGRPLKKM